MARTWEARAALRVAVGSDQLLVGQAVRVALSARDITARMLDWRTSIRDDRPALQLSRMRPDAGLVVCRDELSPVLAQVQWLFAQHPVRWVVVTGDGPDPVWGALVEAGAGSVLSTSTHLDEVIDALYRLAAGERLVDRVSEAGLLALWDDLPPQRRETLARLRTLTPREHAVLEQLTSGRPVPLIASSWQVAEATVRSQVKSMLRKLGVSSQLQAVAAVRTLCGDTP